MNQWISVWKVGGVSALDWSDRMRAVQTYQDGVVEYGILDYEDFDGDGEGNDWPIWDVVVGGKLDELGLTVIGGVRRSIYDFEFFRFID